MLGHIGIKVFEGNNSSIPNSSIYRKVCWILLSQQSVYTTGADMAISSLLHNIQ